MYLSESGFVADVQPADAGLLQGVTHFAQVVAVAGHPVEAAHFVDQPLSVAIDFEVGLRGADIQRRIVFDHPLEAHPAFAGEIGNQHGHFLAGPQRHLRGRAIVRLEMGADMHRFEVLSVHLARRGAVRHGHHVVVGEGRVAEEHRLIAYIMQ